MKDAHGPASHFPLLRLTQIVEGPDHYRVELALEGAGSRLTAISRFEFKLTEQDRSDLRWYLEDYLQYPFDPAPQQAARIEGRMCEIGAELFQKVFEANRDVTRLWSRMYDRVHETRVEIITSVVEATAIPWELLHDPQTDTPLALRAQAFVRTLSNPVQPPRLPTTDGPIRILLVICRPSGGNDVAFRSVASRMIKGLSEEARAVFQLDVLRPPTFEQLGRKLRDAKASGKPYHVVHFDGHGMYGDQEAISTTFNQHIMQRTGKHGYLAFENPRLDHNHEPVDGPTLGKLLVETNVPVLVLNACRSAHADASEARPDADAAPPADITSPHEQVRAFGSLAQEVMDAGAAGVVAMRYNVYVVTAAQFVSELYATLTQGLSLGEAVTRGRKHLADQPLREVVSKPLPLQDWSVPIVYEAAPVALFPRRANAPDLTITLNAAAATPQANTIASNVPPEPDVGFWGRDETLLALDRAFDDQPVVLLHAFAGSGKTTTAAEFARWYSLTGGIDGPVLWTSFEQYTPLPRVLDTLGRVFERELEQNKIQWLALTDEQRREVALQVLAQIPVLWVWDNVEPITGFPSGTESAWSAAEQRELADFLRAARNTRARFLLTSRRDERGWLGDLPARIAVLPMPLQERMQLARALAQKHGWKLHEVGVLRPLLVYTQGNPLTITVLVGQALRDNLRTTERITAFVDKLRAGEARFEDEVSEGRTKSLGASLSYGFEGNFSEDERKILALLHFFQGFVDVDALRLMGHPDASWCLPEIRRLTRDAGMALLDRAAEVGLLTAYGDGYYAIHPALPWYFNSLFAQYYPTTEQQQVAACAFVEAMGELGNYYVRKYNEGNRNVISVLEAEEANLLHARQLARKNGWWDALTSTMQGLRVLYYQTGRRAEWKRLVEEIVPDFVDLNTDSPLPGREEKWSVVTEYRVVLAKEALDWAKAERLQRTRVEWNRQRVAPLLAMQDEVLDAAQRNKIRSLAASLHEFGEIRRELGQAECVAAYEESLRLSEQIGERSGAAVCAFNLGHAYNGIPAIRDLAQAEHWYRRSLELRDERDELGRGKCNNELGTVAYQRFMEARAANQPSEELIDHLNAALQFYFEALKLLPRNAVNDLAVVHNQIGIIYNSAGELDRAMPHHREAIRYYEAATSFYGAGQTRFNVALALYKAKRFEDALLYAEAALRNFESYGAGAAADVEETQQLIAAIKEAMQRGT